MPLLAGIGPLGVPELIIIAFIVILIFGVGRLPEVGGAVGKSIKEFRKSTKDDGDGDGDETVSNSATPAVEAAGASAGASAPPPAAQTPAEPTAAADNRFCSECGARNTATAKFCESCGRAMGAVVG